ncbi:hypothetical protein XENOCAPTIV_022478 [Xenoophorus captivus]|uniref:Uncharacterized protein n=1 Tax=Xenoophorus captivus TaxID=1517983 RepID=A0ABV0RM46_9TELE
MSAGIDNAIFLSTLFSELSAGEMLWSDETQTTKLQKPCLKEENDLNIFSTVKVTFTICLGTTGETAFTAST